MPKIPNNVVKPQDQLRWFLNKLISLSENPVTLQSQDEVICFPVNLLRKEETGLFPLGRYTGSVEFDSEDQEYAQYCKEMLQTIKSDIYKLENKSVRFNEDKFSWDEDDHNYFGYGYAFFIDCDNKPLFESYLHFINSTKKYKRSDGVIEKIEILEDKSERGRINIYVNGNYENGPMDFSRNKRWGKMYELAKSQEVPFEKSFYDYFNYQQTNPLFTKGFKVSKILKEQDGYIVPNIEIKLTTPNKITRQLKSA